ncbi:hypothetical protein MCGE09_00177 [Thaumarchaeota archaeon SCGC AB-539-E09]|nr:hypothetical protein MCGE09_00177 [Thaumarchaeota archaeon SCGC AB-539-E09]
MRVVAWVSLLSQNQGLNKWLIMQCIKEASTIRGSQKKEKPSPRIVFRHRKEDNEIKNYMQYRRLSYKILRAIFLRVIFEILLLSIIYDEYE